MKKIFTLLATALFGASTFAQSIGIVGAFNGWANDVVMTPAGGTTYTASAVVFGVTGGAKFRQDADWAVNWGSADFPSGVGTQGGADIPVPAGTYDITFDMATGAYNFTTSQTNFDVISMTGVVASGQPNAVGSSSMEMFTADGDNYVLMDVAILASGVNFSIAGGSTYGGSAVPAGIATVGGSAIPVQPGYYNVAFNKTTGAYGFQVVSVGLIGSAIPPYDWSVDVDMTSTDNGVTHKLTNFAVVDGAMKFRASDSWTMNWGELVDDGTDIDTATVNAGDIVVTAGTYNITFNRYTGLFCVSTSACTIAEGFPAGVSVNEVMNEIGLVVAPNPTEDKFTVSADATILSVEVLDLTGKTVLTTKNTEVSVDNLIAGTYIYKVNSDKGVVVGKFVKK